MFFPFNALAAYLMFDYAGTEANDRLRLFFYFGASLNVLAAVGSLVNLLAG